jgi:hypothetical protein
MKDLTYSKERRDYTEGIVVETADDIVMETPEERLKFVVNFAGMDLDRLRDGDWLNLREDLQTFVSIDQFMLEGPSPRDEEYTADEIRALQRELQQVLGDLVAKREPSGNHWPLTQYTKLIDLKDLALGVTPLDPLGMPGHNMLRAQAPARNVFFLHLFLLLCQEPTGRILRCPECGTIFYRVRGQRYCTRRCVNRVNRRDWVEAKRQRALTASE